VDVLSERAVAVDVDETVRDGARTRRGRGGEAGSDTADDEEGGDGPPEPVCASPGTDRRGWRFKLLVHGPLLYSVSPSVVDSGTGVSVHPGAVTVCPLGHACYVRRTTEQNEPQPAARGVMRLTRSDGHRLQGDIAAMVTPDQGRHVALVILTTAVSSTGSEALPRHCH